MSKSPLHIVILDVDTPSPHRKREYTTYRSIQDDFLQSSNTVAKRNKYTPVHVVHMPTPTISEVDERLDVLIRNERVAYLAFPTTQLVSSVATIVTFQTWLMNTSSKYKLSPHTPFIAANIMKKYLCQLDNTDRLEQGFLVCASCLIVADKLDNANGHLKPSRLIRFETNLGHYTVKEFIEQEMHILTTLHWEFTNIHAPHTFIDSFFNTMDIHAKIQKTTRRCLQQCLVYRDCVFLMPSQIAVYSLMASCLYHDSVFRYEQLCAEYARYQPDTGHTEQMCKMILDIIHTFKKVAS